MTMVEKAWLVLSAEDDEQGPARDKLLEVLDAATFTEVDSSVVAEAPVGLVVYEVRPWAPIPEVVLIEAVSSQNWQRPGLVAIYDARLQRRLWPTSSPQGF